VSGFSHEALLYAGEDEFAAATLPFIRNGVEAGERVLVVVSAQKIARLRGELARDADAVTFADMAHVGANPARIIPRWHVFVDECVAAGRGFRGIGEPITPARSATELVECQRHESLLNLAFADGPAWRLLCPYDTEALSDEVLEEAARSHPHVTNGNGPTPSDRYRGLDAIAAPFGDPLPERPASAHEYVFTLETLAVARRLLYAAVAAAGLTVERMHDFVLAAHEIAMNSVRHAGGSGVLRIWEDDEALVCEIADGGRISDPLIGRRRPSDEHDSGRGLWLANQLCSLVQVRTYPSGNVVRLHMRKT